MILFWKKVAFVICAMKVTQYSSTALMGCNVVKFRGGFISKDKGCVMRKAVCLCSPEARWQLVPLLKYILVSWPLTFASVKSRPACDLWRHSDPFLITGVALQTHCELNIQSLCTAESWWDEASRYFFAPMCNNNKSWSL